MTTYHDKLTALTATLQRIQALTDPATRPYSTAARQRVYVALEVAMRELNVDRRLAALRGIESELLGTKEQN